MPVMTKNRIGQPAPHDDPADRTQPRSQLPLRFDDDDLHAALEAYSEDRRQSKNAAILSILEAALRASGHYPLPRERSGRLPSDASES